MRGGTTFEDAITCCNMPPDPFFPDGGHHFKFDVTPYDIPYRSLVSKDFGNLMAAGGASSMDLITWAALRYCTPSVCTGQAAGTAAAMSAKQGIMPSELNVKELQKELNSQGLVTSKDMKTVFEASREVPVLYDTDVVVIGGGPAGIGAALASARNGAKTVLVEKYGCLGGNQTLTHNDNYTFVDDRIQGGIVQEIIDRLKQNKATFNSSVGCLRDNWSVGTGCIYFDEEYYKLMLEEMMEEAGVTLVYHASAAKGIAEGNSLKGIFIETHEGRQAILAETVIDCTGIAHIAWQSGAAVTGEEGYPDDRFGPFKGMHMGFGYGFWMCGVDYKKFREFAEQNVDEWDYWVKGRKLFLQEKEAGRLYTPRNSTLMIEYANGRCWFIGAYQPIEKGSHPWMEKDLSDAEVDMRKQAWSIWEAFRNNVPGFEHSKI